MGRVWLVLGTLVALGCGGNDDEEDSGVDYDTTGACAEMCIAAGFGGGNATNVADLHDECACMPTGQGDLEETACDAYCADFGVPASVAEVSGDTCVCDNSGG